MKDHSILIEALFKQYHKGLCNLSGNIVRDRAAAEDIVQEVFLKLWKRREEIDFTISLKPYLYKATTNTSINWLNRNKINVSETGLSEADTISSPSLNTENRILEKELQLKIKQAMDKLPPKCKAIFVLNRYEGLKYKEVAETLDISVKTVENQMGIALSKLRKELNPYAADIIGITALLLGLLAILFS